MNKQKYLFLSSLASLSITTLVSPSCVFLKSIQNEIPKKWDTYSLLDEKIIFNQDNSPKDITIKSIENEFYKEKIKNDQTLTSKIIILYTENTFPFDYREKDKIENDSTIETFNRDFGCHYLVKKTFKKFIGYKNNFLFDFHTNIFLGQKSSFVNEYQTKMLPLLPKLDYDKKAINFDEITHFAHYWYTKKSEELKLNKDTNKYLFFTGTNLYTSFNKIYNGYPTDWAPKYKTFYWLPYVKENKIHFVRTIRNEMFMLDILERKSLNNSREVMLETNIFDIEKLAKKINLPANEEFDVQKHVVIEKDVYYRNFSDNYRKNMIMTKYDLIDKIGTTHSRKRTIKRIIERIKRKDKLLFPWEFDSYLTVC